jgi:hypothetical protein
VFDLDTLYRVRDGHLDPAVVGYLASEGKSYLRAHWAAQVYLSRASLQKNIRKHPDVSMLEYLRLPIVIADGLIVTDRREPNCVVAVYNIPNSKVRYKAIVKCAAGGYDLWVTTFHRLKPRQTKALLKGGQILKTHARQ